MLEGVDRAGRGASGQLLERSEGTLGIGVDPRGVENVEAVRAFDRPVEQRGLAETGFAAYHECPISTLARFREEVLDAFLLGAPRDLPFGQSLNRLPRPRRDRAADGTGQFEPAPKNLPGRFLQERNDRGVTLQELLDRPLPVPLLQVTEERGHHLERSSDILGPSPKWH